MHRYTLFLLLLLGALALGATAAYAGGDEGSDAPPAAAGGEEADEPDDDEILPGFVIPEDLADLAAEMASFAEDVEDLQEPVDEFAQFDQCMFLIGITSFGGPRAEIGFPFTTATARLQRPAFAMDIRGIGVSQFNFLAFPGEEPPQIECNEDAGGEFTDE